MIRRIGLAPLAAAFGSLATAIWGIAAVISANHGFDTSDEGFYLLSYRWWNVNTRTFSGVQYLYGPVFELLGYNIAALRVFRLITILAVHIFFAWSFMTWLRQRRPNAPASRMWEFAGGSAIVAAGAMMYGWLPLSPGYNDVSLLGWTSAAGLVLLTARYCDAGKPVPPAVPLAFGPIVVASMLAKWASAAVTLPFIAVIIVAVLWRQAWRAILRFAGLALASCLVCALLVHLLIIRLDVAIPQMLEVNRIAAAATSSPQDLLLSYIAAGKVLLKATAKAHGLLFVAAVAAMFATKIWARAAALAFGAIAFAVSLWHAATNGGLGGGTINLWKYPNTILGFASVPVLVGIAVVVRARVKKSTGSSFGREGRTGWAVYLMLLLLPLVQALGTGNALHFMAINAFSAWMAVIVAIVTGIEDAPAAARWIATASAVMALVAAVTIGTSGLWRHPYRTAPYAMTNASVPGVPALASMKIDERTAAAYASLHQELLPYLQPDGRAIMGFDEMAGIVLLLGGRPVGEAWYSQLDTARSAVGIKATCDGRKPWWGDRRPILIFNREVRQSEIDALQSCGLVFATDYRLLAPPAQTMNLQIFVPIGEGAEGRS